MRDILYRVFVARATFLLLQVQPRLSFFFFSVIQKEETFVRRARVKMKAYNVEHSVFSAFVYIYIYINVRAMAWNYEIYSFFEE